MASTTWRTLSAAALTFAALALGAFFAGSAAARIAMSASPGGSAFSVAAETPKAPKVVKQPLATSVEEGQPASFEASASGVPAPSVQWEVSTNGGATYAAIEGASADQLTIASATTAENGEKVRAVFTNASGKASTAAVVLTVHKAPVVSRQPVEAVVEEGQSAVFEAAASAFPAASVASEVSSDGGASWGLVPGGTSPVLSVASAKTAYNGRLYRATFKNVAGRATTEAAALVVRKAPAIVKQPLAATVEEGQSATFEATASGFPAPSVQWQLSSDAGASWNAVEGATSNQLTVPATSTSQSGEQFRAVFTNAAGVLTSAAAVLSVQRVPSVTQQPASQTVEEGQSVSFEAAASGFPAPSVQWEVSSNGGSTYAPLAGATSVTFTIAAAKTSESARVYRAVFKNAAGSATSSPATLTVRRAPSLTRQPASVSVNEGLPATFEATASGFPAPSVQWQLSADGGATWSAIEGASAAKLTIASATVSESGREFRAVFTNAAGEAVSSPATLTVHAPPVITEQPLSTTVEVAHSVSFTATATGVPTPSVQWERSTNAGTSWTPIAGATSEALTISAAAVSENGNELRAVFTNSAGTATSAAATLTVATNHYSAVAWGDNLSRQLGDGVPNGLSSLPVSVSNLKFVAAVAAGGRHSLAVLANSTVVAWGSNEYGQLGDGTITMRSVPVAVKGLTGVKAIAAGANHSLALLTNGTVMAWGNNEYGQLGNGTFAESGIPVPVKGLTGVKAISAGANHNLALLANGTVMAWGNNEDGQLGTGNLKTSDVPVLVKGLSGVAAVSAGGESSFALLTKGTVEAWGSNEQGQLGSSTGEEVLSAVAACRAGSQRRLRDRRRNDARPRAARRRNGDGVGRRQLRRARRRCVRGDTRSPDCRQRTHGRQRDLGRSPGQPRAARAGIRDELGHRPAGHAGQRHDRRPQRRSGRRRGHQQGREHLRRRLAHARVRRTQTDRHRRQPIARIDRRRHHGDAERRELHGRERSALRCERGERSNRRLGHDTDRARAARHGHCRCHGPHAFGHQPGDGRRPLRLPARADRHQAVAQGRTRGGRHQRHDHRHGIGRRQRSELRWRGSEQLHRQLADLDNGALAARSPWKRRRDRHEQRGHERRVEQGSLHVHADRGSRLA